ncbi:BON domain-containing protein [Mariniblastus fucicola]|uniref:BON domain protein n=1 Tax=Mariniblastus fucicola TaxID=980251 RepID=A0A5B9PE73_9BACT|nr:BON domain-containing protein [Mariniblastus fucicola]QEG23450.1 BON domain protein [Mariniblastus fucicola]
MGKGMEFAVAYRDEDITKRVRDFLARQHFPALQELEIETARGELTVRGEVLSFYEKQIAMSICQRVPGVRVFVDEILVAES